MNGRWNTAGPWPRRLIKAVIALLVVWTVAWLGVPPLLKWQLEKQASAALGRSVSVARVDFRPWSLELEMTGLKMADASGTGEQFSLARLYVDAELQSVLRLAPVVDALVLEQPHLRVRHLGAGRYDIDDVLQRLQQPSDKPPAEPARFALFNVVLTGGEVDFVDDPVAVTHHVRALTLKLPFLSNLASRREVHTRPELDFVLNGNAFGSNARSRPFAAGRETHVALRVPTLDLQPYLPYWPAAWPLRPQAGTLHVDLQLAFEQRDTPQVLLSGDVALTGVRVQQQLPGTPASDWLSFDRLGVTVRELQPLARRVHLSQLAWSGPQLALTRDAQGRLDLQRMVQAWGETAHAPAQTPVQTSARADAGWQVEVDDVLLDHGTLRWQDAAVQPVTRLALEDLRLAVKDARWPALQPVPFELSTRLGSTSVSVQGSATQASAHASARIGRLPLATLGPYLAASVAEPLAGQLEADLSLDWQAAAADRPMGLVVGASRLALDDFTLGAPKRPQLALQQLLVQGAQVDLAQQAIAVEQLRLQRPRVQLARDSQGLWSVQRWLKAADSTPATPGTATPAERAQPWSLGLKAFELTDGSLDFADAQPADAVHLVLSALQVKLENLRPLDARQPVMPITVAARVAGGGSSEPGRLNYTGSLRLPAPAPGREGLQSKGRLLAERLPLHALVPYFGERLNLELLRADASYRGEVDVALPADGLALRLTGDAALDDLRANTLAPSEELLTWKTLNLRGLQLALSPGQPMRLVVGETVLSDYFARVIVSEQGRINLQGLLKEEGEPSAATGTGTVAMAPATPPPAVGGAAPQGKVGVAGPQPDIRFGPVSLVNGRVLFSDHFIKPNYSADLSDLSGGLSAFTNASTPAGGTPQLADLSLRGKAEGTAALEIVGKLNPLAQPLALDIKGKVRDLELPPLSPYSAKYAGYGIERGKLSVDVAYSVAPDGQLNASNQIVLNQLAFGDRVEGSDAPNLPVKLAVALLADRNGVIDINLPVSGSINDPQFRLGPIIFKLVFNLIGKAITAPFSLLAGAFGGGGDELSQITFAPGDAHLGAEAGKRLDVVAKALSDRPALQLTVTGHSDLEVERSGWRRARLDAMVQAEKRRAVTRSGGAVTVTAEVSPAEYPALLKEVYRRADISKPRNLIGMAKDIPVPDMEALLLASIPVTADAMRELAVARGVAVKDYLASRGAPEDRMFLGAPQLGQQGDKWVPQAALKLAPR